jgi:hypothetical protein
MHIYVFDVSEQLPRRLLPRSARFWAAGQDIPLALDRCCPVFSKAMEVRLSPLVSTRGLFRSSTVLPSTVLFWPSAVPRRVWFELFDKPSSGFQLIKMPPIIRANHASPSRGNQATYLPAQGHSFIQSTILYDGLPRPSIEASRSATALEGALEGHRTTSPRHRKLNF